MILSLECGMVTFLNVGWWINDVIYMYCDIITKCPDMPPNFYKSVVAVLDVSVKAS